MANSAIIARLMERSTAPKTIGLMDYLEGARGNPGYYRSIHGRLKLAMGEPKEIDTSLDPRLGKLFTGRKIRVFERFKDFFGMESVIEEIYDFLTAADQGLEESRQILYLLGPVGSAKSSLAERIKQLAEDQLIAVLAYEDPRKGNKLEYSPMYESPLGLFPDTEAEQMEQEYGIPKRYFRGVCSPWATKRLREDLKGDVTKFKVVFLRPSRIEQIGISKTEPGDDNNQDISALVGKLDVRKLEEFSMNDPDAYSYSGGLCYASQGLMEFVEMFKAPIKVLHPLLTATQEGNFMGTETIGAMPFLGLVFAHSNEAEWEKFSTDRKNEAFLDRVKVIRVPYNLRVTEEQRIYEKLLSVVSGVGVSPFALEFLSRVAVQSRLAHSNRVSSPYIKARIYDGEDLRDEVPDAATYYQLRHEEADPKNEGMSGLSTRTAFKILSATLNGEGELGIDPVKLAAYIEEIIKKSDLPNKQDILKFVEELRGGWLLKKVGDLIRECLLEDYQRFAQTRFLLYIDQANTWLDRGREYKDPETGQIIDKASLDKRMSEVEKAAGVSNPKEFRQEVTNFVLRHKAEHGKDSMPAWDDYMPVKQAIMGIVEKQTQDLLPLISMDPKRDAEQETKHKAFMQRMQDRGFTSAQTKRVVAWYLQRKNKA